VFFVDPENEPEWGRYFSFETTVMENAKLGRSLADSVKQFLSKHGSRCDRDARIGSIIMSARLGTFSELLRRELGLPVADDLTLMSFLSSSCSISHYHDASVLRRLDGKIRGESSITPNISAGSPQRSPFGVPGKKLGLLQLEELFPPAFGDMDHPNTFGFQLCPRVVKGLTFEKCQEGSCELEILESMSATIKQLENEGVVGITGNCGFMMFYQCFARHVAKVPVFMSPLIQAASIAAAIEPDERVLILTANGHALQLSKAKLLLECGIQVTNLDRFVIRGCQAVSGFEAVERAERVDTIKVQNAMSSYVQEIIAEENSQTNCRGPIKIILLECTELPHYADELRRVTGMPVFDAVTCANFYYKATAAANWNSDTYAPDDIKFWDTRFGKDGRALQDGPTTSREVYQKLRSLSSVSSCDLEDAPDPCHKLDHEGGQAKLGKLGSSGTRHLPLLLGKNLPVLTAQKIL
jgi:hypothetical protein